MQLWDYLIWSDFGFTDKSSLGEMTMYFGCRTSSQDNIYGPELEEMKRAGVLTDYHVALSREPDTPKVS